MQAIYTATGLVETDDLNTPVTNEAPAEAMAETTQSEPGEVGQGPEDAPFGEIESIPGYVPPAELSAAETGFLANVGTAGAPASGTAALAPSTSGLRDIGEASFGPPAAAFGPEAIIGTDDRVRVNNTAAYPWRAIASLAITAADGSAWIGTGWFISPRTLITAGHCVFIKNSGVPGRDGWVRKVVVMPGRNAGVLPYGQVSSSSFRSVVGWTASGNEEFDYAAIILPTPLGSTTGWFGIGVYPDGEMNGKAVNVAGYPGDKPSGTHWYGSNKVTSVSPRKVFYAIDTYGGQSGAPVWRNIGGKRFACAVHAYGGATANSGTRINSAVYANLQSWKA